MWITTWISRFNNAVKISNVNLLFLREVENKVLQVYHHRLKGFNLKVERNFLTSPDPENKNLIHERKRVRRNAVQKLEWKSWKKLNNEWFRVWMLQSFYSIAHFNEINAFNSHTPLSFCHRNLSCLENDKTTKIFWKRVNAKSYDSF